MFYGGFFPLEPIVYDLVSCEVGDKALLILNSSNLGFFPPTVILKLFAFSGSNSLPGVKPRVSLMKLLCKLE